MTQQDRIEIGEMWLGLAAMYGKEIQRAALSMMLDAVSDLPADRVKIALREWARVSKNRSHPLPADLIAQVFPTVDDDSMAREIASRIVGAVSKFGWPNPTEAKQYIGDVGWGIVERYGGWLFVCQNLGVTLELGTFQAQARDLVKAQLMIGRTKNQVALQSGSKVTDLIQNTVRSIDGETEESK